MSCPHDINVCGRLQLILSHVPFKRNKLSMIAAETFIVICRKIGVEGRRSQTTTYTYHRLHKKVTPPPYKGKY